MKNSRQIRITHRPSGEVIAEGMLGWNIMSFEGNYYIRKQCLKTSGFKVNFLPGLCIYKFLFVWMDFHWSGGKSNSLGWLYWLPNPLFPFIWYRVAVPASHPELEIQELQQQASSTN